MVLLKNFGNIFKIPELTRKLLFSLGVLVVSRIGTFIPAIGINVPLLAEHMKSAKIFSGLLSYFDTFSGGALQQCTIFALGISPYITASIMMQMLSMTVPSLELLMKEGDYGRKVINQYTRYLALLLSIGYGVAYALYLNNVNATTTPGLLVSPGLGFTLLFTLSLTVGSMFTMWLSEQISLFGIGNGSSMIIFAGIVARFPGYFIKILTQLPTYKSLLVLLLFLVIAASIVFLEKGERKIPVQYARRIIGQRVYGGQSTYIPFKINTAGVMPVIFASSLLNIPLFLVGVLVERFTWLKVVSNALNSGLLYNALEFALIIFFTFFYTAIAFNPTELADNIKKSGGFIPGIRPGKQTADFFDFILTRIGLVGAVYLGVLAIAPNGIEYWLGLRDIGVVIGGTSLLIMVGVALETSAQIESYLIEHRYEGFLTSGRMKSKVAR
ncbi:preprotein translocase subunit SecY [Candidatus Dependentiae bacterium]|nr:preprotein translocase subunit SecY [Candidatus Dependentiae bacterium]